MAADNLHELKKQAKRLGVTWREVCQLKEELIDLERERRWEDESVRRRAWELYLVYAGRSVQGCIGFWRCGWDYIKRRLDKQGRDFTSVPRYDNIHATIAEEFPAWQARDPEQLFDFLFSPYEVWPSRENFYAEALHQIEAQLKRTAADVQEVPF